MIKIFNITCTKTAEYKKAVAATMASGNFSFRLRIFGDGYKTLTENYIYGIIIAIYLCKGM
jgi:hypothetical protein